MRQSSLSKALEKPVENSGRFPDYAPGIFVSPE